jgi:hypothetical protein
MTTPHEPGNPVLSVYQTDIIYYGNDLLDWRAGRPGRPGRKDEDHRARGPQADADVASRPSQARR